MSYDSVCDTCAREACNARMDGLMSCGMHVSRETNYDRLFGTPEKAAETFAVGCFGSNGDMCEFCVFEQCDAKLRVFSFNTIKNTMLEWLEEVAE